jgi:hypothetical protein
VWGKISDRRRGATAGRDFRAQELKTNRRERGLLIISRGKRTVASGINAKVVAVGPRVFHVLRIALRRCAANQKRGGPDSISFSPNPKHPSVPVS